MKEARTVGWWSNGICRSPIGVVDGEKQTEECQDRVRALAAYSGILRPPIGSGWVERTIVADSRPAAAYAFRDEWLPLELDRGKVEIVVLSDGTWDMASESEVVSITSEQLAMLNNGSTWNEIVRDVPTKNRRTIGEEWIA